jgi:hypothetical protein
MYKSSFSLINGFLSPVFSLSNTVKSDDNPLVTYDLVSSTPLLIKKKGTTCYGIESKSSLACQNWEDIPMTKFLLSNIF